MLSKHLNFFMIVNWTYGYRSRRNKCLVKSAQWWIKMQNWINSRNSRNRNIKLFVPHDWYQVLRVRWKELRGSVMSRHCCEGGCVNSCWVTQPVWQRAVIRQSSRTIIGLAEIRRDYATTLSWTSVLSTDVTYHSGLINTLSNRCWIR